MKKFVTAIIISFVVTVSSAGIKAAAFSSSNIGAAFVLSNVMSDEKNDKNFANSGTRYTQSCCSSDYIRY